MNKAELVFARPDELAAKTPPEIRGAGREDVRVLVSSNRGHEHARFGDLPRFLSPGDLLVVNESATLPASLPAAGRFGSFILNLSTNYGRGLWAAEPRWSTRRPGPLPFEPGDRIVAAGVAAKLLAPYPGIPRLWFVSFGNEIGRAMRQHGRPIRYGYLDHEYPLDAYQTIFARVPGSAEMPSAGRPFQRGDRRALEARGIEVKSVVLHTGVSSLEVETDEVEEQALYPEPFQVPAATAKAVNEAHEEGRRVIAVGTTVVRALESAVVDGSVEPLSGFTRLYIHPARGVETVDGLITGFHDPVTSHLAMLYAIAGKERIRSAYEVAVSERYLWHEFGDSHLIFRG
ncbi:MAG: S-adenosylmethionine:tRNA ribosyltransferase-isomerase [Planctomycetaceae bacterium]